MHYYVYQFNSWWSFDTEQWRNLMDEGVENGGVCLPEENRIRNKPIHARSSGLTDDQNRMEYYSGNKNVRVECLLGWDIGDYQEELEELEAIA